MLTFISKCFRPVQAVNGVRCARVFGETDELVSLVVLAERWRTLACELVAQLLDALQVLIARAIQSVRRAQLGCREETMSMAPRLVRLLPMFEQR